MSTRLERYKIEKRNSNIKKIKSICIFLLIGVLIFGLRFVNQTIIDLECLDNTNILRLDFKEGTIDLFGKSYESPIF